MTSAGHEGAGAVLRAARERAGISVRQLASRMKVSPATILDAEGGGDPRASTLSKYLCALPTLDAHSLLGRHAPPPEASRAAWDFVRDVLGFSVARLRFEVTLGADGRRTTLLHAEGVRPASGSLADPATLRRIVHLLLRGSHAARVKAADDAGRGVVRVADAPFTHELVLRGSGARATLAYRRIQSEGEAMPPGTAASGSLGLAAPFPEGASLAVEHAIERLEIVVRAGKLRTDDARAGAWSDLQTVTPDQPDFLPWLHPEGAPLETGRSDGSLALSIDRPVFGLLYGIGWGAPAPKPASRRRGARSSSDHLREAREQAGLSQRDLAERLKVSPATIALGERGQDLRRSHLVRLLAELPALLPDGLLARSGDGAAPLTRREAWEHSRRILGVEADEERKTLIVTAEGDAHAVCETLRLRRVRPGGSEMRVRYSSVQALGKRLPTVLKAIEQAVAAEAQDSGLKARVVARREGRLIHEITVPAALAQVGASYSRRLFDAGFFDPRAPQGDRHDGAAIVPFHPVRRLRLAVTLPPGRWPQRVVFGVHPRMMLDGPLEEADVAQRLHPEGLETRLDESARSLELSVDWPLVGFMYDVFWS